LFAIDAAGDPSTGELLPWQRPPFARRFDEAGLWVVNRDRFYAVIGLSNGGTVSVFDKTQRRLSARNSGLVAQVGMQAFTSQSVRTSPPARWSGDEQQVDLDVPWKSLSATRFTPLLFIAFRIFTLTLGRLESISRRLKGLLVHVLIHRSAQPPFTHVRRVTVLADGIGIADDLHVPGASDVSAVEQFTSIHMGSALYADVRSVNCNALVQKWNVPSSSVLHLRARLTVSGAEWKAEDA
jgi:hypothetical protein